MSDKVSKQVRRKTMQAIKSKDTKLERLVLSELWKRSYRFRRNVSNMIGKPDIAIKKHKIVIFIDSCFWHGCRWHCRIPTSNVEYWKNKIARNRIRDAKVTAYYKKNGWHLMRIWEHQIKKSFDKTIKSIILFIDKAKGYN